MFANSGPEDQGPAFNSSEERGERRENNSVPVDQMQANEGRLHGSPPAALLSPVNETSQLLEDNYPNEPIDN